MGDEELAAAGVFPGERHSHGAAQERPLVELIANGKARPSFSITARVSVLDDEVWHHAMNLEPIEEPLARERHETPCGLRRIEDRQLEFDRTLGRLDEHVG